MRLSSLPAHLLVLALFTALAAFLTHPLLQDRAVRIASDPGDPLLNAAILWWNATVLPLSEAWWNQPYFYPTPGVTAFTEHLLGVSVIAAPIFWLTGDPIETYNLMMFVSWPLSAFATYLLVFFLTGRTDAALVAGLAWGFGPYRLANVGHLQSLSAYWLPLVLLGLHGYLRSRRWPWLALFGISWLCQALANNYFLLFTAVLIPLWVLYFCSTRAAWRSALPIAMTWIAASVPLVPLALGYLEIHERFGLRRALNEWTGFSLGLSAWRSAAGPAWIASRLGSAEQNLFPGVTAAVLLMAGVSAWLFRHRLSDRPPTLRIVRGLSALVVAASLTAALVMLTIGPIHYPIGNTELRMTDFRRVLYWLAAGSLGWILLTPPARAALARRSPIVFYAVATVIFACLACGPLVMVGTEPLLNPAPYAWLMQLPGFDRLRVPSRIWMLGTLCLAVAAGLSFASLRMTTARSRLVACIVVVAGLLVDGWVAEFPMYAVPSHWPKVERRDQRAPLLELPLGPAWDSAATFRSMRHRRPVVNGVSGYDPPFYAPLQAGLEERDPQVVVALASLGEIEVVVDGAEDRDGRWAAYVAAVPSATATVNDGVRTAYRVVPTGSFETALGAPLPIAAVSVSGDTERAAAAIDGRMDTQWENGPQHALQWIAVDLGQVRDIAGVTHALGEFARDFPRELAIEASIDGAGWDQVLKQKTAALAMLGAIRAPTAAAMRFSFPPRQARYVRLRQLATHRNLWRVSELQVHAPAPPSR